MRKRDWKESKQTRLNTTVAQEREDSILNLSDRNADGQAKLATPNDGLDMRGGRGRCHGCLWIAGFHTWKSNDVSTETRWATWPAVHGGGSLGPTILSPASCIVHCPLCAQLDYTASHLGVHYQWCVHSHVSLCVRCSFTSSRWPGRSLNLECPCSLVNSFPPSKTQLSLPSPDPWKVHLTVWLALLQGLQRGKVFPWLFFLSESLTFYTFCS